MENRTLTISAPASEAADALAQHLGISTDELFSRAINAYLSQHTTGKGELHGGDTPVLDGSPANVAADVENTVDPAPNERQHSGSLSHTAEDFFRHIFESNMIGIGLWTGDGTISEANQAMLDILGYTRENLTAGEIRWRNINPEEYKPADAQAIKESNARGVCTPYEKEYIRKDGHRIPVWVGGAFMDRDPTQGVFFALDLSARKRLEEAQRAKDEELRIILDSIPGLIAHVGADERYSFVNASYARWFGQSPEQFIGRAMREVLDTRAYGTARPHIRAALRGSHESFEDRVGLPNGTGHDVLVTYTPRRMPEGTYEGFYIMMVDVTQRKQIEERNRFQARLLDAVQQAVVATDAYGHITYWNQSAAALYGWSTEEAIGRHIARIISSFGKLRQAAAAIGRLQAGETWTGELEVRQRDGMVRTVQVTNSPLRDAKGTLTGVIGVSVDISDRIRAEEVLRIRARQQAAVATLGQRALRMSDLQAILDETVQIVCETLGVEFCKVLELQPDGRTVLLRAGRGWKGNVIGNATFDISSGSPAGVTLASDQPVIVDDLRTDGRFHNADLLATDDIVSGISCVIADKPQRAFGVLGAYTTDARKFTLDDANFLQAAANVLGGAIQRHRTEETLRANERMLQLALSAAQMGTWEADMHSRVFRHSASTDDLFGFPPGNQTRSPDEYAQRVHPDDRAQVTAAFERAAAENSPLLTEFRIVLPDGSVRWVLTRGEIERGADGSVSHVRGSTLDITDRKRAEQELRELNETLEQRVAERTEELQWSIRELDQFAHIASHDLRAPLRAIDNLARWIAEDSGDLLPDSSKQHLDKLQRRAKRMEKLLDDLLHYARAGRYRHIPEVVDTGALVRGVVDLLSPPPGFTVSVDSDMPTFLAERVPLETVLRNLIGNAFKHHHCPQEGHVDISAQAYEDYVEFTVADDGPGIDPQFHERIFFVFQTLQPRDQGGSSGVGLSIVKKTVESRGGIVSLVSSSAEGSSFRFTWPKMKPNQ